MPKKIILIIALVMSHLSFSMHDSDFLRFYFDSKSPELKAILQEDKILGDKCYLALKVGKTIWVEKYYMTRFGKLLKKDESFKTVRRKFNSKIMEIDTVELYMENKEIYLYVIGKDANDRFLLRVNKYGLDKKFGKNGVMYF